MSSHVYANGMNIACKAADGKSVAAFPDVCWSPPGPSTGPIPIPYANTAYARDLKEGSCTVFINRKPIFLKDKSYIRKSTGNEAATNNYGKGLKTGKITGRAYFKSWSHDVFIEGENVCRHGDLMTHNHGSLPGNTGCWRYLDDKTQESPTDPCYKEQKKIDKKCRVSKKENDRFIRKQDKKIKKLREENKGKTDRVARNKTWKDDNCISVMIKPSTFNNIKTITKNKGEGQKDYEKRVKKRFDEQVKKMKKMTDLENSLVDYKDTMLEDVKGAVFTTGINIGAKFGAKQLAKAGAASTSILGGPVVSFFVGCAFIADTIHGGIQATKEFIPTWKKIQKFKDVFEEYNKQIPAFKEAFLKKDEDAIKKLQDQVLESMKEGATKNACLAARKCMLVPYEEKKSTSKNGQPKEETSVEYPTSPEAKIEHSKKYGPCGALGLASTAGCCPGQTGHHVIPNSWTTQKKNCSGYQKNDAPTVCVEGVTMNGIHGEFHKGLNKEVENYQKTNGEFSSVDMNGAIKMAAKGHRRGMKLIFKNNTDGKKEFCSEDCITAQLTNYYKNAGCGDIKPLKGRGKFKNSPTETDNDDER